MIRGTINCILVITTLQLSAACQIRLHQIQFQGKIPVLWKGIIHLPKLQKNEYLFKEISVLTTTDTPKVVFLV